MDSYVRFIQVNIKYTVDIEKQLTIKKLSTVDVPFSSEN